MAFIDNTLGQNNTSSGSIDQNNIIRTKSFSYLSLPTKANFANIINSLSPFTIGEKEIFIFSASNPTLDPNTFSIYKILLKNLGKGSYGVGGVTLTAANIEFLAVNKVNYNEVISNASTQIFNMGEIGSIPIYQYVNELIPSILIQNQSDGYVLFQSLNAGVPQNYLYLGTGGLYGNADLQTLITDYQILSTESLGLTQDLQNVLESGNIASIPAHWYSASEASCYVDIGADSDGGSVLVNSGNKSIWLRPYSNSIIFSSSSLASDVSITGQYSLNQHPVFQTPILDTGTYTFATEDLVNGKGLQEVSDINHFTTNSITVASTVEINSKATQSLSIGEDSGNPDSTDSVLIGRRTGFGATGTFMTSVGNSAGISSVGNYSSSFGYNSGNGNLGDYFTSIGYGSGVGNVANYSTSIGASSGYSNVGESMTAVGAFAGTGNAGNSLTTVGAGAGQSNTGNYVTAIGASAGISNAKNNVILLNAGTGISAIPDTDHQFVIQTSTYPIKINTNTASDLTFDLPLSSGRLATTADISAGTGTVTSVTSVNSDISVATTTSTPVLTLNSGSGANQIVKRNGSGLIPDLVSYATTTYADAVVQNSLTSSTTKAPSVDAVNTGLSGKQNSLGYTAENSANKENTTLDTSTTKYPTNNLVKTYTDAKVQNSLTASTTIAPSATAVNTALGSYLTTATASSTYATTSYVDGKVQNNMTASTTLAPSVTAVNTALGSYLTTSSASTTYAPIASPTHTGTLTTPALVLSSETASTIASFDTSKNVKSLSTTTYPSLTELSYGKGVTSAIQTQIDSKISGTSPTITTPTISGLISQTGTTQTGSSAIGLYSGTQTWNTTGNVTGFLVNITNTASGSFSKLFDFQTGGTSRCNADKSGNFYSSTSITTGGYIESGPTAFYQWSTRSKMFSPSNGNIQFTNQASSDFGLLQLGGTTSSFPALKRSTTTIEVKLADDSAYAAIQTLYSRFGSGSPEGVVTAPIGARYSRTDGGAGTSFYVKESGTGNTGWVAK